MPRATGSAELRALPALQRLRVGMGRVREVPRVWTRRRKRARRARYSTRYPRRPALRGQSRERRNRESVARRNHPHRLTPYSPASLVVVRDDRGRACGSSRPSSACPAPVGLYEMLTVLFALQKGEQVNGPARRSCERPWYEGQINLKWKASRWTSANFNSVQSKLMALVSNMMWLSTAARFASAGRSPRRNSARSSDTPRYRSREEIPWKCQRLIVGTGRYDRFR